MRRAIAIQRATSSLRSGLTKLRRRRLGRNGSPSGVELSRRRRTDIPLPAHQNGGNRCTDGYGLSREWRSRCSPWGPPRARRHARRARRSSLRAPFAQAWANVPQNDCGPQGEGATLVFGMEQDVTGFNTGEESQNVVLGGAHREHADPARQLHHRQQRELSPRPRVEGDGDEERRCRSRSAPTRTGTGRGMRRSRSRTRTTSIRGSRSSTRRTRLRRRPATTRSPASRTRATSRSPSSGRSRSRTTAISSASSIRRRPSPG